MEKSYNEKVIDYIQTAKQEGRTERIQANTIDYLFITEQDGWISIIERKEGRYIPCLQANNREHALTWITMREPVTVQVNSLV